MSFDFALGPHVPHQIGRFAIVRELGRGGLGIVFLARDPTLGRLVALKIPRLEVTLDAELSQRFLREAKAMAILDHPHIVPVYEAGQDDTFCFIISAYCDGATLADWLRDHPGPIPGLQAATLVGMLAEAVHYAHDHGILHRDLKPSNILLHRRPSRVITIGPQLDATLPFEPRVADFGLASFWQEGRGDTRLGVPLGTPAYMAPEQLSPGRRLGPPADVYALGVILYELLVGRVPFTGDTLLATLDAVRAQEPVRPTVQRPAVPRDLETICLRCLHKDPDRRYATAAALAADLQRFLKGEAIHGRPRSRWTRCTAWCRQPERTRSAGTALLSFGLVLAVWCIGMIAAVLAAWLQPPFPTHAVAYGGGALAVFCLPMIVLGWLIRQGQRRALWGGTIWAGCFLAFILGVRAFFPYVDFLNKAVGWAYLDPTSLFTFDLLVIVLAAGVVVQLLIAAVGQLGKR